MNKIHQLTSLNLKLMFTRRSTKFIYILVAAISVYLLANLYGQADKGFKFPVAIVDKDDSRFSNEVIHAFDSNELISGLEVQEEKADKLLRNHQVEAVITILEGAGRQGESGDPDRLFEVAYLKDNSFTMMLMDILSKDVLAELSLLKAAKYYNDGMKDLVDGNYIGKVYNKVYNRGKTLDLTDKKGYYLSIDMVGHGSQELEWYNQNLFLEKMIVGILYILVAFFLLFSGLWMVNRQKSDRIHKLDLVYGDMEQTISGWLSLSLIGFLMTLPVTGLSLYYGKGLFHMLAMNILFVIGMAAFVYFLVIIFSSAQMYLLLGTSLVLAGGIMTGAFFPLDDEQGIAGFIAHLLPGYYSSKVYFNQDYLVNFTVYTMFYMLLLLWCSNILRKVKKNRSMS